MATNSSPTKGRDHILSLLDAAIEALNLAKEISSHTPAKAIFGAAGILLAMIRVCPPLRSNELLAHVYIGLDGQQTRLRRAWAILRPRL